MIPRIAEAIREEPNVSESAVEMDMDAVFDDVSKRYPLILSRLAESERDEALSPSGRG